MIKLKEIRLSRDVSQQTLAKLVNRSAQTILNWENGIHDPSVEELILLADFFNISIDYLVGRIEYENVNAKRIIAAVNEMSGDTFLDLLANCLDKMKVKKKKGK